MSRLKTGTHNVHSRSQGDLTLAEALHRLNNPRIATSLSRFYAQLAKAQREGDQEAIDYIRGSILEAMHPLPEASIDVSLRSALRVRDGKRRKQSRKVA